jgi:hypothetical protein
MLCKRGYQLLTTLEDSSGRDVFLRQCCVARFPQSPMFFGHSNHKVTVHPSEYERILVQASIRTQVRHLKRVS